MTPGHPTSSATFSTRLAALSTRAAAAGIGGVVIVPGPDLEYLLGSTADSHERFYALVVPATGKPATVIAPAVESAALRRTAAGELGLAVRSWSDGEDPYALAAAELPAELPIAVSAAMAAAHLLPLSRFFTAGVRLATPLLRELTMLKDADERAGLQEAAAAIDRVFAQVPALLRPGRTEAEIAALLHEAILGAGHTQVDFVIVGSGPNGADPHHDFSDRVLAEGDCVVVDLGGRMPSGYRSDCTRTFTVGAATDTRVAECWAVLQRAYATGADLAAPGVSAGAVDDAVRAVVVAAGYGEYFTHRTGHGIGLSTHEEPYIVHGNDTQLQAGMTFSIEPGIYLPGEFGMRLENIVQLTDTGAVALNRSSHALINTLES